MKVEILIKPPMLSRVNTLLARTQFENDTSGRVDLSIAMAVSIKLARKSLSFFGKDKTKAYKITLAYHEAELLERKLRFRAQCDYEMHYGLSKEEYLIINEFCNHLHQKLF